MQRRTFLGLGGALFAAAALGGWSLGRGAAAQPLLLSARNDADGRHYAVGYRLDGQAQFATPVRERCHDVVPHPALPLALFVGRRPSRESYLIDTRDGRLLQTVASPADRHFYGHAVFHRDGEWLYSTENDTREPGRGVLGVWRLDGERLLREAELSSHGVGPHQLLWMPDGETLVVANGGIRTEADSREAMNLDAMEPSLVLLRRDGSLLSKETLPERMNSVRHLAVADDGTVVSGQQYEGAADDAAALVAIKRPGGGLPALPAGRDAAPGDAPVHRQRGDPQRTAPAGDHRAARQPGVHLGPGQRRAAPRRAAARLRRRRRLRRGLRGQFRAGPLPALRLPQRRDRHAAPDVAGRAVGQPPAPGLSRRAGFDLSARQA